MKNKLENIWSYTHPCVYLCKLNDKEMEKYTEQIQEIARFATNRGLEITLENIE